MPPLFYVAPEANFDDQGLLVSTTGGFIHDGLDVPLPTAGSFRVILLGTTAAPIARLPAPPVQIGPPTLLIAVLDPVEYIVGSGVQLFDASIAFDGEQLTYAASGADVTIDPDTGMVAVATEAELAATEVTIIAANAAGSVQATWRVTVSVHVAIPDAPIVTGSLDDLFLVEGAAPFTGDAAAVFSDDVETYSITGTGASIDAATGAFSISAETVRSGSVVAITGANAGGSVQVAFQVTVEAAETAVVVYSIAGAPTQSSLRVIPMTEAPEGDLRIAYSTSPSLDAPSYTPVFSTDADTLRATVDITDLPSNTRIYYQLEQSGQAIGAIKSAKTAGTAADPLRFAFASCGTGTNSPVYDRIAARSPDFFLSLGDTPYTDYDGTDASVLRGVQTDFYKSSWMSNLLSTAPWLYVWDDHDYGPDNSGSSSPAKAIVQQIYRELQPHYPLAVSDAIYHAYTIGAVRFIVMDLRSERTATQMMSAAQMTWVKAELSAAAAAIKLVSLVSTVPWIASSGIDTWSNWPAQRVELGDHILAEGLENRLVMLSGDAHMLAHDDGTNNTFNTAGVASFPVFQSAPLEKANSTKGRPYTTGPITTSINQYSVMDVQPDGLGELDVTVTGYSNDAVAYTVSLTTADPAPPVAAGAIADQSWTEDMAITPLDVAADFTGTGITYALAPSSAALPAGLSLSSAGVISGTPTTPAAAVTIVVRGTNLGGFADTAFSGLVTAAGASFAIVQEANALTPQGSTAAANVLSMSTTWSAPPTRAT